MKTTSTKELEKKKRERYYLHQVKHAYAEFPSGTLLDSEEPDFLIPLDSGILGIELVDYVRGQGNSGSEIRQLEKKHNQIVALAQKEFEATHSAPLQVHFFWGLHKWISITDTKLMVDQAVKLVEQKIPSEVYESISLQYNELEGTGLEEFISYLSIVRLKPGAASLWSNTDAGFIDLAPDELQTLISSKETKMGSYLKKCTRVWLIIVADSEHISSSVSIKDDTSSHSYLSQFEKVLFYNLVNQQVIPLSISRP